MDTFTIEGERIEPSSVSDTNVKSLINPEQETLGQSSLRNIARSGVKTLEGILGTPGDIVSSGLNFLDYLQNKITSPKEGNENAPSIFHLLDNFIPTTETIQKYGTENLKKVLPQEYLTPQGEYEEAGDDFFNTLGSLATPLLGPLKAGAKTATKLAATGGLAKFGAKKVGFSPAAQEGIKVGTMILTSLFGKKPITQYQEELYDAARKSAQGETSGKIISDALNKTEKSWKYVGAPEKGAAEFMGSIENSIKDGKISLEDLLYFKERLNKFGKAASGKEKDIFDALYPVRTAIKDTIKSSEKIHPIFSESLIAADSLTRELKNTDKAASFLKKHISSNFLKNPLTKTLLGIGSLTGLPINKLGGIYLATSGIKDIFNGLKLSRPMQLYYAKTISAAAKENVPLMLKNMRLLDNEISKAYPLNKSSWTINES